MRLARSRSPSAAPTPRRGRAPARPARPDDRGRIRTARGASAAGSSEPAGASSPCRTAGRPPRPSMRASGGVSPEPPRCCSAETSPDALSTTAPRIDRWRPPRQNPQPCPLHPRVVQPGHRRAGRLGPDDHARPGAGSGRRRRPDPARLGGAAARRPRRLHAPRRRRAARRHRRDRRAAGPRAGQAAGRGLHDGAAADRRRAALVREGGAEDPRRREGADDAGLHAHQERPLLLRADRRRRRDRALELPLVDPLRRGRDRADGRQRRRPEAGQPDAAAGRADPPTSSRRAGLPEGLVRVVHGGGARRRRARPLQRRQGLLHRLGRGRPQGRRGLRRAASRARCWSSAARTR